MADSDFVTGMVVGGGGRAANAWEETAAHWERAARSHERTSLATSGLLFGVFDVLKTLPIDTRVQILTSLRDGLAPAARGRFAKRGLKSSDADAQAVEFLGQLEAAWSKTAAASPDEQTRRPRPRLSR